MFTNVFGTKTNSTKLAAAVSPSEGRLLSFAFVSIVVAEPGFTPGVVRRSPLIDALHPAVAKQREFQLQLRRTRHGDTSRSKDTASEATETHHGPDAPTAGHPGGRDNTRQREQDACLVSPLPAPPTPAALPLHPSPVNPSSEPRPGQPSISREDSAAVAEEDAGARAGRLTVPQWGRVEAWMARIRSSLGRNAWGCLGSGDAFCRALNRVRNAALPGGGRGCCSDGVGRPLWDTYNGWVGVSLMEGRAVACGEKLIGPLSCDEGRIRTVPGGEWGGPAVGCDGHLSDKTALAIQATMWALATSHERSTTSAAIFRDRCAGGVGVENSHALGGRGGKQRDREGAGVTAGARELGVSLPRARRYVKACPLIDGVSVLEADVDLAFKRWWEEAERSREVASAAASTATPEVAPWQCMCEAVGCSEVARYGDIHPMAEARLCRRHRYDGMTDVGGKR